MTSTQSQRRAPLSGVSGVGVSGAGVSGAGVTAMAVALITLLMAGCSIVGGDQPTSAPSPTSEAVSSASSATARGTTPPASPGFAEFNPAAHETYTQATSPDRAISAGASSVKPPGFADPPAGQGYARYSSQKLVWQPCQTTGVTCARVRVPLNWDRPDGQAITLGLARKKASGTRRASLFVNPGGPGGSGMQMAAGFDGSPFPSFDIIGWDPRGSGTSTPVVCGTSKQTDAYNALDPSPANEAQRQKLVEGREAFAAQCRAGSGALLDHISTIDTARDLDYLRYLMGDRKLAYLGISYGTWIGSVYAELYPTRVNRMVLDSAVNITDNESVTQAMGFESAFTDFAAWCVRQGDCAFGTTADQVRNRINGWLVALDRAPIRTAGHQLGSSQAITGIAAFLYAGQSGYENLYRSLQWAMLRSDPRYIQLAADQMVGRRPDGGYTSMAYSFPAITCADWGDRGVKGAENQWVTDRQKAPIFGFWFGINMACPVWTAAPAPQLKVTAKGSPTLVVLGSTGDPATPFQQSQWMADQLANAVLLTRRGPGHSAYMLGGPCITTPVQAYLNGGAAPKPTTCA